MEPGSQRYAIGTGLVAAMVAAAGLLFVWSEYRNAVAGHRRVMIERGETLLDSLAAGLRAQGRMSRHRSDRIAIIFEELVAERGVLGLRLETQEGVPVAEAGDTVGVPAQADGDAHWQPGRLAMSVAPDLGMAGPGPGFMGRGRGPWADGSEAPPFPPGPYRLTVTLDTAGLDRQVRALRARSAVAAAIVLAVSALGAAALAQRVRQRSLQSALAVARERASESERLAQLGAGLAHETRNPLGVVRGLAQGIADAVGGSDGVGREARRIVDEVDRTVGRLNAFVALARPKEAVPAPVVLPDLAADLVDLLRTEAEDRGVTVEADIEEAEVLADPDMLRRLLLNLLLNALRACDAGCRVSLRARGEGDHVSLRVEDTGCGIDPEDLPRVKEPYFTRFAEGSGLGLAIADQIARAHDWTLELDSAPGQGTVVRLEGLRKA